MDNVHLYSKIVDQGTTSPLEKHAINASGVRGDSGDKRKWSPGVAKQELAAKKHEREQKYAQNLDEKDRPVLHIQAKTVYKDLAASDPLAASGHQDKVFRTATDARPVSPLTRAAPGDVQPKTAVLANPNPNPLVKSNVSKIEGVEVLPKGYLDLDPLLYKDEYRFDSKVHEEMFREEQRRIKAKRMKQYLQRNEKKERNITIFVVEKQKNQILEYLDNWFAKTDRLMNQNELEYVAKTVQSDPASLAKIQEAYFQKLKAVRSRGFDRDLIRNQEVPKVGAEEVPETLKKYFLTNPTDNYNQVEPRVNSGPSAYNQAYLSKYNKLLTTRKHGMGHKLVKGNAVTPVALTSEDHLDQIGRKFGQALENASQPADLSALNQEGGVMMVSMVHNALKAPKEEGEDEKKKTKHIPSEFDREITAILAKIIEASEKPKGEGNGDSPRNHPKVGAGEPGQEPPGMNIDAMIQDMAQNPDAYRRDHNLLLSEIMAPGDLLKQLQEDDAAALNQSAAAKNDLLFRSVDPTKTQVSALKATHRINNPIRSTTVFKNDKGKSVMIQKLKPLLFRNEYIYQTVIDSVDTNNTRSIIIQTRRETGEVISDQLVDLNLAGNFYDSYIIESIDDAEVLLVTRNENKATVARTVLTEDPAAEHLKIVKVFQRNGHCVDGVLQETTPENESKKTHRLRPVILGGEFYRQQVEELSEGKNKKTCVVLTYNDENLEVSQVKVDANLIQTSDYCEIESDHIDEEGTRHIVLITKNDQNEVLAKQTFTSNLDSLLADHGCTQMVEEVEYDDGQKQITVGLKNARDLIFAERKVTSVGLEDEYFVEVTNDFVRDGSRHLVLAAKSFDGELLVEKLYKPQLKADITMAYYEDMLQELRQELGRLYVKPTKRWRFQEFVTFSWVRFELRFDQRNSRLSCRAVDQRDAVLLEKFFDSPRGALGDSELTDELLTKMEKALEETAEGGLRRRRFKADFLKTHTVLNQQGRVGDPHVPQDSHLNFSYYKNATGPEVNLTESQVLARNPLPRYAKIPRSYFRNLQKEMAIKEETVADYMEEVQRKARETGKRGAGRSSEKHGVPIRAPRIGYADKNRIKEAKKEPSKPVRSAFGSTLRVGEDALKGKSDQKSAYKTPNKKPHEGDGAHLPLPKTPQKKDQSFTESSVSPEVQQVDESGEFEEAGQAPQFPQSPEMARQRLESEARESQAQKARTVSFGGAPGSDLPDQHWDNE